MRQFGVTANAVAAALGATMVLQAGGAGATTAAEKCQSAIARSAAKYAQARLRALQRCEDGRLKAGGAGSCPDTKAQAKIDTAEAKKAAGICKACGGTDKACGGAADTDPRDVGWFICPGFEGQGFFFTESMNDVVTCVDDINSRAVDQLLSFIYGVTPSSDSAILKCQRAIGKNVAKFFQTKSKRLQRCWDRRIKGKHSSPCPDATATTKIQAAEQKKIDRINQACGAFTPAQIGITTCPDVGSCGATIADVAALAACVDCVAEFKVDCIDALQVPQFATYPPECTPPGGGENCPDTMELERWGGDIDYGSSGFMHDQSLPGNNLVTLALSGCTGGTTCGLCNLVGPIPNTRLPNNRRCSGDTSIECTSDTDCPAGACSYYLGNPLPLSAGGISVCLANRLTTPVLGTVNLDTGDLALVLELENTVFGGISVVRGCPTCEGDITPMDGIEDGACNGGDHNGDACDVTGDGGPFGPLSFDCPPTPGVNNWGEMTVKMNPLTTGTDAATLTAGSPACTSPGYASSKCMCDTCVTPQAEPCFSDADCPGGATCGGKRCIGGIDEGTPCSTGTDCSTAVCWYGGALTRPNSCGDAICSLEAGDTASAQEGRCDAGPFDLICRAQPYLGCGSEDDCRWGTCSVTGSSCVSDSNCPPGETCEIPHPADVCGKLRNCFMDNGEIGGSVIVAGEPDPLQWSGSDAVAYPTLGALFCQPPILIHGVNDLTGFPGLGRITVPATVVFHKTGP